MKIEQHEALRIPAGWRDQERAFVLQLDRVFTDIYKHFKPIEQYELPEASSDSLGGIMVGFTQTGQKYPVELEDGQAYVYVPWTDTNTWRGIQNNLTSTSETDSLSAKMGKKLNDEKVAKSGDTMTGNLDFKSGAGIRYQGTAMTGKVIEFIDDGDASGLGVAIGRGGLVVIGAGESADAIKSGKSAGTEDLYLGADGVVYIMTNVQNGTGSAKTFIFSSGGRLTVPNELYLGSQNMAEAVKSISRNGTTFTATRCNGTTFTFTQQDSNTWRGFQVRSYDCSYTVGAGTYKDITANDFGASTPSGYTPVAVCLFNPGNDQCWISAIKADATGSTPMMTVHNPTGGSLTNRAYISILYLQT